MTRKECERAIVKKLREIWDIYQLYFPGGKYLGLQVSTDHASVCDAYWEEDKEKPLDYYEFVEEVGADATGEE